MEDIENRIVRTPEVLVGTLVVVAQHSQVGVALHLELETAWPRNDEAFVVSRKSLTDFGHLVDGREVELFRKMGTELASINVAESYGTLFLSGRRLDHAE